MGRRQILTITRWTQPPKAKKVTNTAFSWRSHEVLRRDDLQYYHLPFGGSNRCCIGMAFALYEPIPLTQK
ncbi:MAG: cytochrome P450 [Chroococcus sp. CMT-3BRIN-NPC107]|nr:cytochrome P450 [Chroococcus sp. CMT-3BRIN-NPC107]